MKVWAIRCVLLWICLSSLELLGQAESGRNAPEQNDFAHLPLFFEANKGQAGPSVEFLARGAGYTVLLGSDKTELVLPPAHRMTGREEVAAPPTISIEFLRANKKAHLDAGQPLPGKSNYFFGKETSHWLVGIPQYGQVRQRSIYPGVDLVYYGNGGDLEYDFVITPGSDPNALAFRVRGSDGVDVDESGDLVLKTPGGILRLRKPTIYQERERVRRRVEGKFVLRGGNEVGLFVGDYDAHSPLIVDPVLTFSTLIGANDNTQVQGIAVDSNKNVYITGTTFATNYPVVNAYQSTSHGYTDVFITKLSPSGNTILYSTYLGSSGFDNAAAIAVDGSGAAYVTGTVGGADFPTTPGAFMTSCPGICNTPFLTKFSTDGTLAFSTFMGGSNSPAHAVAVNAAGEAYIAGDTASNDLPTTPGSFEPTYPGELCTSCYNGYVEKLNAAGTALLYSTYFGAVPPNGFPPATVGSGIAVDSSGSAYLVGNTTGIPLQNALQSSIVGGPNAFIAKFSPDGSALTFSTYLGGTSLYFSAGDSAIGVAVDANENVHVVGTTSSCEFPLTLSALSTDCVTLGDNQKVFVLSLNSSGNRLLFSTLLQSGFSSGIGLDSKGNSYVTGTTTSSSYFVKNAIENTAQYASSIGFITELDPAGKLLFSTYLGASYGGSVPAGIAVDASGDVYVAGEGQGDFPLLHPIPSQTYESTYNTIFVSKISPSSVPQFSLSPRVSPILTLRNVSSVPLTISSIVPSSNFTMEGNCGNEIAAGSQCELILLGADDKKTRGSVTITSNAYPKPQTFSIQKSAGGDRLGYSLAIFPTYVQFPVQYIGTSSATQKVAIQNLGLPAAINSISIIQPAAFTETNDCPAQLATGASCTISLTYTAATVQDSAQLAIITDPYQTRYTVFLSGLGSNTAISASTQAMEFGAQFAGGPSISRIVNLANATPNPATITGISTSSGYVKTSTCSAALPPHGECRVSLAFAPTGNQDVPGTLTVSNYGPGGPETVSLHGTGLQAGDLVLSPNSLNFLFAYIGIGANNSVTVTNNSTNTIAIQNIGTTTGPFSQTNTCPPTLSPAATCQISITFQPTVTGAATGSLSVTYSGNGSPQTMPLSGIGVTQVQFNPSPVDFGQQLVNTTSATGYAGLVNYGFTTFSLGTPKVQGSEFVLTQNGCGTSIIRNTGCWYSLIFTPSGSGLRTGTLSVVVSDYSQPLTVTLQGTGISTGVGSVSATSLTFGPQKVGTKSAPQKITFTNTGSGTLSMKSIKLSPSFFTATSNCGTSLLAGAQCTISIYFQPTLQGILAGSLSVQDDGLNGQHTVTLSGTGQ